MAHTIGSNSETYFLSGYEVLARWAASSRDGQNQTSTIMYWLASAGIPFHGIFKFKIDFRVAIVGFLHSEDAKSYLGPTSDRGRYFLCYC